MPDEINSLMPPSPQVNNAPEQPSPPTKKKNKTVLVITFLLLLFLVLSTGIGFATLAAIAYGKVNVADNRIKNFASSIVMSLPFMPKTPEYVIQRSVEAHKKVSGAYVDASIASNSKGVSDILTPITGLSNLDVSITGPVDFSNNDYKADVTIKLGNQFDSNLIFTNEHLYLKLNKIPAFVSAYLSPSSSTPNQALNKWVDFDLSPLKTEANKELNKGRKDGEEGFDLAYSKLAKQVLSEKVAPKIKMSAVTVDGNKSYKLSLELTGQDLEEIDQELNKSNKDASKKGTGKNMMKSPPPGYRSKYDYIKKVNLEWFIDAKTYFMSKLTTKATLAYDSNSLSMFMNPSYNFMPYPGNKPKEDMEIVMVLKLSRVGEKFNIVKPAISIDQEEFFKLLMANSTYGGAYGNTQVSKAAYASIKNDLHNVQLANTLFISDNARLPYTLEELEPKYLVKGSIKRFGEEGIRMKVLISGKSVFIYTIYPDPSNSLKPYYGITMNNSTTPNIEKYYSEEELKMIVKDVKVSKEPYTY